VAMVKVAAFANAAIPTTEANPKTSDLMFIGLSLLSNCFVIEQILALKQQAVKGKFACSTPAWMISEPW